MRRVKKLSKQEYYKIYSMVPRMTIDLIIFHENGIILSRRDIPPCKGMWHLPGGTILLGEGLSEAAIRISKEEVGLLIKPLSIIGIKEYTKKAAFGQVVSLVFVAKALHGQLRGNKYARQVKTFTKLPENMIKEQKDMLIDLGLADPEGSLKIFSESQINRLTENLIKCNSRLWRVPL